MQYLFPPPMPSKIAVHSLWDVVMVCIRVEGSSVQNSEGLLRRAYIRSFVAHARIPARRRVCVQGSGIM